MQLRKIQKVRPGQDDEPGQDRPPDQVHLSKSTSSSKN